VDDGQVVDCRVAGSLSTRDRKSVSIVVTDRTSVVNVEER